MRFTCEFCEKQINGLSIIVDNNSILHQECEKEFKKNKEEVNQFDALKAIRKETIKKWDDLGFLKDLKGHAKEDVAKLYECCTSSKIIEK